MSIWSGIRWLGRDRHFTRGMVHFNRGEYAEAAVELERAIERIANPADPDHSLGAFYAAEARQHLALACLRAGDEAAAEAHFRRAIAANPEYPDLHVHLAAILERRGALEEAARACQQALERNPRLSRAWLVRAVVADRTGDRETVARALGEARAAGAELPAGLPLEGARPLTEPERQCLRQLEEGPTRAQYHAERALELYAQADAAGALEALDRAVEAQPRYPDLRARRASLLAELGRHAEAVEEWHRALALNPSYAEARFRLAVSLLAEGRTRPAADAVLQALERLPDDRAVLHLAGLILLADGRAREAERVLERAGRHPPEAGVERLLGLCKLLEREMEEAERLFRAARQSPVDRSLDLTWLALRRGDAEAAAKALSESAAAERSFEQSYGLGQAARARGRHEEAEAEFDRALETCAPESMERGLALLGRGAARLERRQLPAATEDLEEAARLLEYSAEAWLLLGRARRRGGAARAAEQALRRAVDCYPGWPESLAELADHLTREGRGGEAAEFWERVRRVDPLHPLARAHRGEIVRDALHRTYGG